MTPVKAIILGYGIRGRTYAAYAETHPHDLEIVGVADPLGGDWTDWATALQSSVTADAVIIALPDHLHLAATRLALQKGYHVLLEKPIGCTWAECEEIKCAQRAAQKLVLTGYVLRYAPFYQKLRELLTQQVIGELTSVHHLVAISFGKASHAFCRGNWSVEAEGTGMLVNKCTHDFDLIEWWTKGKTCQKIVSFGSLFHWRKENQPAGAADRCTDCPKAVRMRCPFDAYKLYYDSKELRYHFADESDDAILRMIETSQYGRCVYACENDSVDHQTVLMEYEGGLTITLEMESYSHARKRVTHFYGTRGEIVADEESIQIKPFLGATQTITPTQTGAHGGGDREIMTAFVKFIRTGSPARYNEILDVALESHRLAFLAEESRATGKTIYANRY